MDKNDEWGTNALLWTFGLILGGIVLADVTGRFTRLFIREWPYISCGLAILFTGVALIWVASQFDKALAAHNSGVTQKLGVQENRIRGMDEEIKRQEARIAELKQEVIEYRRHSYHFIKRLDEVAAQKGPAQPAVVKSSGAIQAAAKEIMGGAA